MAFTLFEQRGQSWPREGQELLWGQAVLGNPGWDRRGRASSPAPPPVCVLYFQGITYLRIPVADTPEVPM